MLNAALADEVVYLLPAVGDDIAILIDFQFRMLTLPDTTALEFFGVDVWMRGEGMSDYYSDEDFLEGFNHLFTTEAADSVWVHPKGDWVEW